MQAKAHCESVYTAKEPEEVSWYHPHLDTSLALIERVAHGRSATIINVGAGASTLIDDLVRRGYTNVTALDISETALYVTKQRLGPAAAQIQWLTADVCEADLPLDYYDVWHDWAVFHFLTVPEQRASYVTQAVASMKINGHLIVSTFGPEGPTRCSGLDIARYNAAALFNVSLVLGFVRWIARLNGTQHLPVGSSSFYAASSSEFDRRAGRCESVTTMPCYRDHIYPHLVNRLGNPKPFRDIREQIVPLAKGTVLEIGVGPGVNFAHYNPARVNKVYALEPNRGMLRLAEARRRQTSLDVEFLDLPGERIPLEDCTVDTVISTFTLCTIPGVAEAIRGIARVLKPGGKFIFFEHGISPDPEVRRWQERLEPLSRWAFEGCHLTRDIPSLLAEGGFQIEQVEMAHLVPFPKVSVAKIACHSPDRRISNLASYDCRGLASHEPEEPLPTCGPQTEISRPGCQISCQWAA